MSRLHLARPVFYYKIMIYRVWTSSAYRERQNTKLVKVTSPMRICRCRHSRFAGVVIPDLQVSSFQISNRVKGQFRNLFIRAETKTKYTPLIISVTG